MLHKFEKMLGLPEDSLTKEMERMAEQKVSYPITKRVVKKEKRREK